MTGALTFRQTTSSLDTGHRLVLPPEPTPQDGAIALVRLVSDPAYTNMRILPLIERAESAQGWYVAHRHDAQDRSFSLQVFLWPSGSMTRIHDHSSWGVFCCVFGSLFEERYERLDDGSEPNRAHLKKSWRRSWRKEDGVSTVRPYDGGIHRVGNRTGETAISVHLYGPRLGRIDGRDYDPSRDHVCERPED